ncbi:hypothetical protein CBR_g23195 [Chara braunii]|uniref:Uncharacterized protein n=1 Tax=Chara braunii TaxID=69332 RepID=A0A388JV28_CHABU|nr:hypothetical protein CBR_g23195 [Chara braunii]|eukprot:GBG61679.1 hypothetical protein CBR_g23195 [Chara braunii]
MRGKKDAAALAKPWLHKLKTIDIQLSDITTFVTDSAGVNMSSMEIFQEDESVVTKDPWRDTVWATRKVGQDIAEITSCAGSPPWWEDLRRLLWIMDPVMEMLQMLDSDTRQISKVLRSYEIMIASCLAACDCLNTTEQDEILEVFDRRRTMFRTPAHTAAMMLDPKFLDPTMAHDDMMEEGLKTALRVQAFTNVVATAKAHQEAAEAEHQRLAHEAATQAQWTAEADATARDKRNTANTESLIRNESQWTALLQGMTFVPTCEQADPTPAEAKRSNLANLMLCMMRTLYNISNNCWHPLSHVSTASRLTPLAAPGCTTDIAKHLGERIDHVVNIISDLSDFTSPATISSTVAAIKMDITKLQSRPKAAAMAYKMPHFNIAKFDDYNKTDALAWWQAFVTEAACHHVPDDLMMTTLYLQLIGGAQAFMNHMATNLGTTIVDLHKHITWEQLKQMWHTRFMVRNVVKAAMNEVYSSSQGNMSTRDWTIKWEKIVTTPRFDSSFPNLRSEFYSRSCGGLRSALGNEYDYASFKAILDRANLVIQTDDKAANERQSQPQYVAKQGYQRQAHNNEVIADGSPDLHAAAASSSDGGLVTTLPPKRSKWVRKNKATQGTTTTETGQQPWTTYNITKEVFELRQRCGYCFWCNIVNHTTAQCPDKGKAKVPRPANSGN